MCLLDVDLVLDVGAEGGPAEHQDEGHEEAEHHQGLEPGLELSTNLREVSVPYQSHRAFFLYTIAFTIKNLHTVGVNKNCTLVFINFSAQDASILKISVPIIKRRF